MQVFKVQGMTCGHCVRAITHAVQAKDSAADVQVDLGAGEVRVASRLDSTQVLEAIREEGYGGRRTWLSISLNRWALFWKCQ
ncbi:cation transporter [Pseudomonas aeruginosa]|nr:cation transporter [Pseudomonas aeruginosa]MDY1145859.1 cation transporter [Pseudomonas aeruginosa]